MSRGSNEGGGDNCCWWGRCSNGISGSKGNSEDGDRDDGCNVDGDSGVKVVVVMVVVGLVVIIME